MGRTVYQLRARGECMSLLVCFTSMEVKGKFTLNIIQSPGSKITSMEVRKLEIIFTSIKYSKNTKTKYFGMHGHVVYFLRGNVHGSKFRSQLVW